MEGASVAAIILNWESPEDVIDCVRSINSQSYPNIQIVVVDNGSTDGSPEYLSSNLQCPVHCLDQNIGFAAGMNKGVELAPNNPEYLWFLNPDIEVPHRDILNNLVNALESNEEFGVISPTIKKGNGDFWFERGKVDLSAGIVEHESLDAKPNRFIESGYVPMTAALVDYSLYSALKGLPEQYFLYYEDVDFCTQARVNDTKVVVDSDNTILHEVSGSTDEGGNSPTKSYYRTRNHLLFVSRYREYISRYEPAFIRRLTREIAINSKRGNIGCVNAIFQGLKDGVCGEFEKGPYP